MNHVENKHTKLLHMYMYQYMRVTKEYQLSWFLSQINNN